MSDDPLSLDGREMAVTMRNTDVFIVPTSPEGRRREPRPDEVEQGLVESGTRIAVATALLRDARLDNAAWAEAALEHGMDISHIARLSGVARGTVYNRRS